MKLIDIGRSGQIRTVMMRYKINLHAPVFGWDKIRIRTYLVKYSKFSSVRRFEVYGENGQLKIEALAVWSMMSLEKMKLVAIPSEVKDMIEPYSGQTCVEKIQAPEEGDIIKLQLRPDDFDHNGHVNNSKYFSFSSLGISDDINDGMTLKQAVIAYEHGISYGADAYLMSSLRDEGQNIIISQKLYFEDTRYALIHLVYGK